MVGTITSDVVASGLLGAVIGYLAHYLVRRDKNAGVKDLAIIVGVILGATVTKYVAGSFNSYLIGVGVGFFLYWLALMIGKEKVAALGVNNEPLKLFPFA